MFLRILELFTKKTKQSDTWLNSAALSPLGVWGEVHLLSSEFVYRAVVGSVTVQCPVVSFYIASKILASSTGNDALDMDLLNV